MDEDNRFEYQIQRAYALGEALYNIRKRREIKKLAREKALSLIDQFSKTGCGIYGCKRNSNFVIDMVILELKTQVPCGNPKMNDHRIAFYNEVNKQIDKI